MRSDDDSIDGALAAFVLVTETLRELAHRSALTRSEIDDLIDMAVDQLGSAWWRTPPSA